MKNIQKQGRKSKGNRFFGSIRKGVKVVGDLGGEGESDDTRIALIQALIPLGLRAVNDELQNEVMKLAGARYGREEETKDIVRWGSQEGSVYLQDMKVKVQVPRVRNKRTGQEVGLESYRRLQEPTEGDRNLLGKVLLGLSCHRYAETAQLIPEVFGMSPSAISQRFIKASAKKLEEFNSRRLEQYDIVAIILDGKTFAREQIVIAVGITMSGRKVFLGFVQTATENAVVCKEFLQSLIERGLSYERGLLFVVDGSKGFKKAISSIYNGYALIQRCQWHKRKNVVSHLLKSEQAAWRKRLQNAYEQPTYAEAYEALQRCRRDLARINKSALASLDEGFEETLTLHRLELFPELGRSLKTTNCLESINAQVSRLTKRVTYWKNSDQKHRWIATTLLNIEPRLNRIHGYKALPKLRKALQQTLNLKDANVA